MRSPSTDRIELAPGRPSMRSTVGAAWTLFAGIGLLMLGNGLQGTLISLRASLEGFATATTGVIMSSYYVGYLVGSARAPTLLSRVGHIRVFAALASLASAAVLLHVVVVDPVAWVAIRLLSGFSMAGLFVVAESWLNGEATNESRGQLLSLYMVVFMASLGAGQLLLALSDPRSFELFVLASVLLSVAVVPMSLSTRPGPRIGEIERVSVRTLFKIAPLGLVGSAGTGLAYGAIFGLGAVYAVGIGFSADRVAVFMAAAIFGGALLQFPLGRLSDRFDRRRMIALVASVAAVVGFLAALDRVHGFAAVTGLVAVLGGTAIPLYSLCVAHANDYLAPSQTVGASATLIFGSGVGAAVGPLATSIVMSIVGESGFFWSLAVIHGAIALYALYRITRRGPADEAQWAPYEPLPLRATPEALRLAGEVPGLDATGEVPIVRLDDDSSTQDESEGQPD